MKLKVAAVLFILAGSLPAVAQSYTNDLLSGNLDAAFKKMQLLGLAKEREPLVALALESGADVQLMSSDIEN